MGRRLNGASLRSIDWRHIAKAGNVVKDKKKSGSKKKASKSNDL